LHKKDPKETAMRWGIRTTMTAAMIVAALLTVGALPAVAQSGDPCGYRCDNQNPHKFLITPPGGPDYRCEDDAITVDSIGPAENENLRFFGVTLQLRYSPRCQTVWARAFGLERSDTLRVIRNPHTSLEDISDDVEYPYDIDYVGGDHWMWSRMMNDAGQTAVACFSPRSHVVKSRAGACTPNPY
jgi:hypothetical protein